MGVAEPLGKWTDTTRGLTDPQENQARGGVAVRNGRKGK